MTKPIEEQVVVITGASSGIGRCTALHLASRGARVVLTARRGRALADVVEQIEGAGGQAMAVPGDVTREDEMRAVAAAAGDRFGTIDCWVNNASVYIQGRVQDLSLAEYRRLMEVNYLGVVNGTQRALEVMLPRGSGAIIQVSSVAARRGVPYTSPYSGAKSAIDGFTSSLRAELWGRGITFSILYPPTVDTPIYDQSRGKLGVVPKPAAPIADPMQGARAIARLAESGARHRYFGWAGALATLDTISPAAGDWLLHRVAGFTYSDIPASGEDNVDQPSTRVPATIRAGWRDRGWRGFTLGEAARVLPLETVLGAAVLGFAAARLTRRTGG